MPALPSDGSPGVVAFAPSPVMSTYQLTAVVGPLVNISATLAPSPGRPAALPVVIWAPDRGSRTPTSAMNFSLTIALGSLSFYESTLGIPFPLPKMDLVYLPLFPVGAMEQWGLVTFTESYLSAPTGSASAASVIAHELSHQWHGNLVTCHWWSELVLNEGFATFWPYAALAAIAPELSIGDGWRAASSGAMLEDAFAASQALAPAPGSVASSGASYAMFNSITYDKGAAAIAFLARWVEAAGGPGAFAAGVARFLRARAYGSALMGDLLEALTAASGLPAGALAAGAAPLLQEPGVPLLVGAWAPGSGGAAGGQLELSQRRLFAGASSAAAAGARARAQLWTLALWNISAGSPREGLRAAAGAAVGAAASAAGGYAAQRLAPPLPYDPAQDGWLTLSAGGGGDYLRVSLPREAMDALGSAAAGGGGGGGGSPPAPAALAAALDDALAVAEAAGAGADVGRSEGDEPAMDTAQVLAWAKGWVGGSPAGAHPAVRAVLLARTLRLANLLVDDVPLAAAGDPAALPDAYTPGSLASLCLEGLFALANASFGLPRATLGAAGRPLDRAALAQGLQRPWSVANASAALTAVAAAPGGRDLAWAALTARWQELRGWYGYRSTLATLARAVGRVATSAPYAEAQAAWWQAAGHADAAPVVDGAWQRAVEAVRAAAEWRESLDAQRLCAWLTRPPVDGVR